jgi:hypothetical protein
MPIHHLHEPIDVFSEWLDDCEAAANPAARAEEGTGGGVPCYQEEDDEDNDVPESSGLGDSRKQGADSSGQQRQNHATLGLDDSDDDDDDED